MSEAQRTQYFAGDGGGIAPSAPGTASVGVAYAPGGTTGPHPAGPATGAGGGGAEGAEAAMGAGGGEAKGPCGSV